MGIMRRPIESAILISITVTGIVFGVLYYLFPIIDFDLETLKTSLFYLFSTNAQALAALIGISYAILYTTITNMRSTESTVYYEPLKRLILSDSVLKISVYCAIVSIICSISAIILVNTVSIDELALFMICLSFIVVCLTIITIFLLVNFAFSRMKYYIDPQSFFDVVSNKVPHDRMLEFNFVSRINDFVELILLIETLDSQCVKIYTSLQYLVTYSYNEIDRNNNYTKLIRNIIYDVNKVINVKESNLLFYNKLICCAWKSIINTDSGINWESDSDHINNITYLCKSLATDHPSLYEFTKLVSSSINMYFCCDNKEIRNVWNIYDLIITLQGRSLYASFTFTLIDSICDNYFAICRDKKHIDDEYYKYKNLLIKSESDTGIVLKNILNKIILVDLMYQGKTVVNFDKEIDNCLPSDSSFVMQQNMLSNENIHAFISKNLHYRSYILIMLKKLDISPVQTLKIFLPNMNLLSQKLGSIYPFDLDYYIYIQTHQYIDIRFDSISDYISYEFKDYLHKYDIDINQVIESYLLRIKQYENIKHNIELSKMMQTRYKQ